jgi:hypothetical protein
MDFVASISEDDLMELLRVHLPDFDKSIRQHPRVILNKIMMFVSLSQPYASCALDMLIKRDKDLLDDSRCYAGHTALTMACNRQEALALEMLKRGANPTAFNKDADMPLLLAINHCHKLLVRDLLSRLDDRSIFACRPLATATGRAWKGNLGMRDMILLLLEYVHGDGSGIQLTDTYFGVTAPDIARNDDLFMSNAVKSAFDTTEKRVRVWREGFDATFAEAVGANFTVVDLHTLIKGYVIVPPHRVQR